MDNNAFVDEIPTKRIDCYFDAGSIIPFVIVEDNKSLPAKE
jgi:hypothetical protein